MLPVNTPKLGRDRIPKPGRDRIPAKWAQVGRVPQDQVLVDRVPVGLAPQD